MIKMVFTQLCMFSLMVSCSYAAHVRGNDIPPPSLLDSIYEIFYGLTWNDHHQTVNATTTQPPPPGRQDICHNLCPKWCEKTGTPRKYSHCHYLCGNLCDRKVTLNNHFIGNPHYEVVRTDYVFSHYDKNEDKLISVEEFAKAEQISIDESLEVFTFADVNADGSIDVKEFQGSPLVFTENMSEELSNMANARKGP